MKKLLLTIIIVLNYYFAFAQWQKTNGPTKLQYHYTNCLAINGTKIFAGTQYKGLYISTDAGNNWTKADTSMKDSLIISVAVIGSNIFVATPGGVYLSTNNGNSWTKKNNGLTGVLEAGAFAVLGSNIFVATHDGVFKSNNNGDNWTLANQGLTNKIVSCFAVNGTNLIAGTNADGIYISSDNGGSWTPINNGLSGSCIYAIAISGTNIYAGTDTYGVNLSTDNGSHWKTINSGLTYTTVYALAAMGKNVIAGTWGGGVFLSTDNGNSWTDANNGLPPYTSAYSFVIDGMTIYSGIKDGYVYKRTLNDMGVGIFEPKIEVASFILYPNPNHGKFVIKNDHPINSIEIYNIFGERIYTNYKCNPQTSNEIDISNNQKGIYFVRLMMDDGKKVYTEKEVLQ